MKKTTIIMMIGIASMVALALSLLVYRSLNKQPPIVITQAQPEAQIVVANTNLSLGTRLKHENLKTISWSRKDMPNGSFARPEDAIDRVLLTNVIESELILEGKLAPKPGTMAGLTTIIPEGKRAFSIRVNEVGAGAGFVVPGTIVDVLVTAMIPGAQGPQTRTILQNVPVLAAGQQIQQDADGKPVNVTVVTLLVSPEEAEKLNLASNEGKIQLALRNPLDRKVEATPGTQFASLMRGGSPAPAPKPKKAIKVAKPPEPAPIIPAALPVEVEVISGNKRIIHKF
jgi:pilus assembly protein CpaB